jgi:hypothetical protein
MLSRDDRAENAFVDVWAARMENAREAADRHDEQRRSGGERVR